MELNDISQEEFERIEAYLDGQLSKDELLAFKEQLKNEDGFAAKVDDIKTVLIGMESQAMKEQLDVFHEELTEKDIRYTHHGTKIRTLHWRRIAIAAILVIGLGSFWFINGNTNDKLYAEYFSPDPGLPTKMSNTGDYKFNKAMVSYKQKNYKVAISTWQTLLESKPKNDTLQYFIGSAFLASKNHTDAMVYLSSVSKLNNSVFKDDAYFYLGLTYLKDNATKEAIKALEQSDLQKSKDLLKKLN